MSDLNALLAKRRSTQNRLARIQTALNKHSTGEKVVSIHVLRVNEEDLVQITSDVSELEEEILAAVPAEDYDVHEGVFTTIGEKLTTLRAYLKSALRNDAGSSANPNPTTSTTTASVKLPQLELPTFNGSYSDWSSYQDLFNAIINSNTSLTPGQKMQYLKSSLKSEAAAIIQSMNITDHNYTEAWKAIKARYENKREIANALLKKLFSQAHIQQESAASIKHLIDTSNECIRALKVLGLPVSEWDAVLVFLVAERLDPESRRRWALSVKGTDLPKFEELDEFIEQHIRGLLAAETSKPKLRSAKPSTHQFKSYKMNHTSSHVVTNNVPKCEFCKENHPHYRCEVFLAADIPARIYMVKKHNLCFNCLRGGHSTLKCKNEYTCRTCKKKHNSLLHLVRHEEPQTAAQVTNLHINKPCSNGQVLMSTAIVEVRDQSGNFQTCRALIDSASEASFISENCVQKLGLKRQHVNINVSGINATMAGTVGGKCDVVLFSRYNDSSIQVETLILPKVTGLIPAVPSTHNKWAHIKGLQLADPQYHTPASIDILLGVDVYAQVMTGGKVAGVSGTPTAFNTMFGWVLTGKLSSTNAVSSVRVHFSDCNTEQLLQRFWEVEHLPERKFLTQEEEQCEEFFKHTHLRDSEGRFIVRLPLKQISSSLGISREIAFRRLKQVERRLQNQPNQQMQYNKFMQEYLSLDHMELIPDAELQKPMGQFYYLPHHHVMKSDSSTTKLRVVFDGSSKSSSGVSLNKCQLVGPKLQDDLLPLLIRFRYHIVALTADIAKMYRQVLVDGRDVDYQRILWRGSESELVRDYRLLTVTYGTASAPYLAVKCLQQLAEDEHNAHPIAAKTVLNDFYVDDLMSGESSTEKALVLQSQLIKLCEKGGFELRKWSSNDSSLSNHLPSELRDTNTSLSIDQDNTIKTLGVKWTPSTDTFSFVVQPTFQCNALTKRAMLSELAKVFDPVGWLCPVTITGKIILQSLWQLSLGWDEVVPNDIHLKWLLYREQLQQIQEIEIKRCITTSTTIRRELLGFSDSSEHAYSAVVYMRNIQSDGTVVVNIITAKTKVAPIKQLSVPRLELCGAFLLCKVLTVVKSALKVECEMFGWTDSTTVLRWLAAHPRRWNTFVANRVSEIQDILPCENWRHVSSEDNPADCASRGISAVELKNHKLWWSGPAWLSQFQLPPIQPLPEINFVEEERKHIVLSHQVCVNTSLIDKYSTLTKLKRVLAYMIRFATNCRVSKELRSISSLSQLEIAIAFNTIIKMVQQQSFHIELISISSKEPLHTKSSLRSLNPFVDKMGLLRVGGRLHTSNVSEQQKHPLILPRQHRLTMLIIQHCHISNLHAGPQLLWATLQQQFWIVRGRDAVRHFVRQCVVCRRQRAELSQQLMGSLPSARVSPGPPFQHCGVDYAGPITLKVLKGRGQKSFKGYISLFVCLANKAVHMEAVSDLTTEAFLAAMKRFVSRRGIPAVMYSDCGTNFVGASKELKKQLQSSQHNTSVADNLSTQGIDFKFNPPSAPHHGGPWEAAVKSTKYHLRRVVGHAALNFEDLTTVLVQIEACLNSRPLCALSTDPDDLEVLTPGHFLIGQPLNAIPEPDIISLKENRLSRWQRNQQIIQHFWRRWTTEYLSSLQQRFKWVAKRANLQINDLVIIKEDNVPPLNWMRGRIIAVHPGRDQCVRVVTVKTKNGILKRPIVKLSPLLTSDESQVENSQSQVENSQSQVENSQSQVPNLSSQVPNLSSQVTYLSSQAASAPHMDQLDAVKHLK